MRVLSSSRHESNDMSFQTYSPCSRHANFCVRRNQKLSKLATSFIGWFQRKLIYLSSQDRFFMLQRCYWSKFIFEKYFGVSFVKLCIQKEKIFCLKAFNFSLRKMRLIFRCKSLENIRLDLARRQGSQIPTEKSPPSNLIKIPNSHWICPNSRPSHEHPASDNQSR